MSVANDKNAYGPMMLGKLFSSLLRHISLDSLAQEIFPGQSFSVISTLAVQLDTMQSARSFLQSDFYLAEKKAAGEDGAAPLLETNETKQAKKDLSASINHLSHWIFDLIEKKGEVLLPFDIVGSDCSHTILMLIKKTGDGLAEATLFESEGLFSLLIKPESSDAIEGVVLPRHFGLADIHRQGVDQQTNRSPKSYDALTATSVAYSSDASEYQADTLSPHFLSKIFELFSVEVPAEKCKEQCFLLWGLLAQTGKFYPQRPQLLQAIQDGPVCEKKSLLGYLKTETSPQAFQYFRARLINHAVMLCRRTSHTWENCMLVKENEQGLAACKERVGRSLDTKKELAIQRLATSVGPAYDVRGFFERIVVT